MPIITDGKYYRFNGKRIFIMNTAITANSTNVPAEAVAGSFGVTTHATGLSKIFVSDGTKWQNIVIT
jgi:hypothetical protein